MLQRILFQILDYTPTFGTGLGQLTSIFHKRFTAYLAKIISVKTFNTKKMCLNCHLLSKHLLN